MYVCNFKFDLLFIGKPATPDSLLATYGGHRAFPTSFGSLEPCSPSYGVFFLEGQPQIPVARESLELSYGVFFLGGQPPRPPVARFARAFVWLFLPGGPAPLTPRGSLRSGFSMVVNPFSHFIDLRTTMMGP